MAGVAGQDGEEGGVVAGDPDGDGVAGEPDQEPCQPEAQAEADGGGERAVEDREAARSAGDQDRLGQRAVQRDLEAGQGLLLGAHLGDGDSDGRPNATEPLPPGSTLLLYTDGLIEIPGSDLDTGLIRLRRHALGLAHASLDTLCDQLLARMSPGSTDDVALLALRLPSE